MPPPAYGRSREVATRTWTTVSNARRAIDAILNAGFFVFHSAWIVFNCVAWAWKRTRRWHLGTIALTAAAWFGLGAWYGWGYCPSTDWHWRVRERLGYDDPPSYIQVLISTVLGLEIEAHLADLIAVVTLVVAAVLSVTLNIRDMRAAVTDQGRHYR